MKVFSSLGDQGEKTAVLINLQEHGELWEDFYDCLLAVPVPRTPRIPCEVREKIHQQGNCMGSTSPLCRAQPVGNLRPLTWRWGSAVRSSR